MPDAIRSVTVAMTVQCEHCSAPVPINGPVQQAHCRNCQRDFPIARLHEELALASEGMQLLGSPYKVRWSSSPEPECRKCEQVVPISPLAPRDRSGAPPIVCPACSTNLPSYPAPDWLRAKLPAIVHVFGGDPENTATGLALAPEPASIGPVAMACPQCSGGLSITAADDRLVVCHYCNASVYLPDALWRRLHPAKTMLAWTVSYIGEQLVTAETLAEAEAERARKSQPPVAQPAPKPWLLIVLLVLGTIATVGLTLLML